MKSIRTIQLVGNRTLKKCLPTSVKTMAIYSQKFGANVIAIHDELAAHGYKDVELDKFYQNPTNPIGIRTVAERIGALGEQIKQ